MWGQSAEFFSWILKLISQSWSILIISAVVSYLTGDTFVNHANKKREHSEKLKQSLTNINDNLHKYYHSKTRLTVQATIVGIREPKIDEVNYIIQVKDHIKWGYPNAFKLWDDYETLWKKRNLALGNLKEHIRKYFSNLGVKLNIESSYSGVGRERPESYILPLNFMESIFQELEKRRKDGWEPFYYKPTINFSPNHNQIFFFDKSLFIIKDDTKAQQFKEAFYRYFDEGLYSELYDAFLNAEGRLESKESDFKMEMKKILDKINLGHNIMGICDTCITILPISIHKHYHMIKHWARARADSIIRYSYWDSYLTSL